MPQIALLLGIGWFLSKITPDLLAAAGAFVATAIAEILFVILIAVSGLLLNLSYDFLFWTLSSDFTKLSYTKPGPISQGGNPIIETGLNFTQNFVNMGLILVLIYAAFSIALRLTQETEAKKILARFIIVALFVNFAPVFCGLVVDASNILMGEFTRPLTESPAVAYFLIQPIQDAHSEIGNVIGFKKQWLFLEPKELGIALWLIIYCFLLAWIFFIFSGILIVRHLAIWVLVIFAPLAFVCAIIPYTQKYWTLWRDQFLKWSFIGVPISFFLFLGFYFSSLAPKVLSSPGSTFGFSVDGLLITSVPMVFFYIGLKMTKSCTAWGTAATVGFLGGLLTKGTLLGKTIGKKVLLPSVKKQAKEVKERFLEPAVEPIAQYLESKPIIGRMVGGVGASLKRREARFAEQRKKMEAIPDTPEGEKALMKIIQGRGYSFKVQEEKIAAIETLAKRGGLDKEKVTPYLADFQKYGGDISVVLKARPDLAKHFAVVDENGKKVLDEKTGEEKRMTKQEAMKKIDPGEFWKTVQKEALKDPDIALIAVLDDSKLYNMAKNMKPAKKEALKEGVINIDKNNLPIIEEFQGKEDELNERIAEITNIFSIDPGLSAATIQQMQKKREEERKKKEEEKGKRKVGFV